MRIYLMLNIFFGMMGCNQPEKVLDLQAKNNTSCEALIKLSASYNPYERKQWQPYNKDASGIYPIDDSLNIFCRNSNPDSLQKDIECKMSFIFLCEKYYLYVYKAANQNRNEFSVYNAHIWNMDLYWLNYALNILAGTKLREGLNIDNYGESSSDSFFVEYIIAEGERNKSKINNDIFLKVHDSCIAIYPKVRDSLELYPPLTHN